MATINIRLRKTSRGDYRISFRIRHHSASTLLATTYIASPSEVGKDGALRQSAQCYTDVQQDLLAAHRALRDLRNVQLYDIRTLAEAVSKAITRSHGLATSEEDFYSYARNLCARKECDTAAAYKFATASMQRYSGPRLAFTQLTRRWLLGYEGWLRNSGVSQSTISTYMRRIRTIHRQARAELNDEELGHIVVPFDPFLGYSIPAEVTEVDRHMELADIRKLRDYVPRTSREELAKDVFFISLFTLGMNAIDMMRCPPPSSGRITYRRSKVAGVKGARATISVKIVDEVAEIMRRHGSDGELAFDFASRYATVQDFRKAVNIGLASICRSLAIAPITFYYARHAFAEIAHQHLGIPLDDVAKCLNHSSQTKSVTFRYAGRDYTRIDDIQRQVADFVAAL